MSITENDVRKHCFSISIRFSGRKVDDHAKFFCELRNHSEKIKYFDISISDDDFQNQLFFCNQFDFLAKNPVIMKNLLARDVNTPKKIKSEVKSFCKTEFLSKINNKDIFITHNIRALIVC